MKNIYKGIICGVIATIVIHISIIVTGAVGTIYVAMIPILLSSAAIYMLLRTNNWKGYLLSVLSMVTAFILCEYVYLFVFIPTLQIDDRNWVFGIALLYAHMICAFCSLVSILIACINTAKNIKKKNL